MIDSRTRTITRVTLIGSLVNILLSAGKLLAGIIGHSGAMIADAVHSISDLATDVVVIICARISKKPKDEDHDYGHGKYETLGSIIIGVSLFAVAVGIIINAVEKIRIVILGGAIEQPGTIALYAAVISILAKEWLYRYTIRVGKKVDSPAMIANAWHHRSDALSSIGTLLGIAGALLLGGKWAVLDPIAAIAVGALILKVTWDLVIPGMSELMEKSLPPEVEDQILEIICSNPELTCPHNLRTRQIGSDKAIEAHIRVNPDMTVLHSHEITRNIERQLKEKFGEGTHVTIHVEPLK